MATGVLCNPIVTAASFLFLCVCLDTGVKWGEHNEVIKKRINYDKTGYRTYNNGDIAKRRNGM